MAVVKLASLKNENTSCPAQWTGFTINGREVYIRFRWGKLRVSYDDTDETIWERVVSDDLDGTMDDERMKAFLVPKVIELQTTE